MSQQNYSNHVKWVPMFHFFLAPVFLANFGWSLYHLYKTSFSSHAAGYAVLSAAFVVQSVMQRIFALKVQDRVIRLEERLRYQRILPTDLQARAAELTPDQIICLRFASDAELPGLVQKILDGKIHERKQIKLLIKDWRADELRA